MKKVYITDSAFKNIIKKITLAEYMYDNLPYYSKLIKILSRPEQNHLLKFSKLLEDFENINKYKKSNFNYENDSKIRLIYYKKSPPSFHYLKSCLYLKSSYENYDIPVEIKEENIEKYREYFKKEKDLYKRNYPAFLANVELMFDAKIHNIREMHSDNSGVRAIKDIMIESPDIILTRINNYIKEMNDYRSSNIEIEKLINSFGYGTHKAKYIDKNGNYILYIKDKESPVYYWHEYKKTLKNLIEKYFIATLNPEFKFNQSILEQSGLLACRSCLQEENHDNNNFLEENISF